MKFKRKRGAGCWVPRIVFLVTALTAGMLGLMVIVGTAAFVAKLLFFVFLVLFVVSLIRGRRAPAV